MQSTNSKYGTPHLATHHVLSFDLRPKYTSFFFTRTLAYVHSRTRSLAKYTSFDSYAYTDVRCMRFAPNCNTSPGLGSSYEDYSATKDMEEKLTEIR